VSRAERDKGLRGEREVAQAFEAAGAELKNLEYAGDHHVVLNGVPFHVEVKRHERLDLMRWVRQAEAEKQSESTSMVVFRQSRQPWRVVLTLEDFLACVRPQLKGSD
jgi:hypothetical protein